MKDSSQGQILTIPVAILLGSFVIAFTILVHGGIIKLGKVPVAVKNNQNPSAVASPGSATAPQAPKAEADIVKNLKSTASQLKLDQGKFDKCLDSGEKASSVKTDLDDGAKVGVNGTPSFFINGRNIAGAVPFEQFKTVIDEELVGNAPSTVTRQTVAVGDLPPLGSKSAKVTMIEFSDYQCPFCGRHFTQAEPQLKKEYIDTGKVVFYYRDFPLSQIHPGAQKAAEAARCAGDQNKYWEYHDLLFQNQTNIF
ncbi:hypothetical protein A3B45_00745 [Candidatus Daviesbacteria bacterium RIFCSPLOWO2_01_FULL_39_12]|uniref:Thioredoxin domain-containing protein n=1 Tax=Candidatus Daviesbacteria bacterium RIFCSPLOWO2_01_FULL_39_12 TaxID=1797785 RepID=A0A1F5KQN0_9BACT|nr:MAG: hypothetical protein A3B45_00745 [Candidatus Daviesbacteria bacterium RIFCSPLOWO2_01_FULL_39_12]